jgi:hypothetical protein
MVIELMAASVADGAVLCAFDNASFTYIAIESSQFLQLYIQDSNMTILILMLFALEISIQRHSRVTWITGCYMCSLHYHTNK